ncbi:MAG TPA: SLBB domain-containing protein [Chthoniobacteraceae bacterium]|nr:SLBB domain-containing protein [Chthoniobacteraceae bacterium]
MKILHLIPVLFLAVASLPMHAQEPAPAPSATAAAQTQITVNVLGAVTRPSQYSLAKGATVLDALALAGDFNPFASKSKVKIIHKTAAAKPDVTIIDVKAMLDGTEKAVALRDGDTIYVPQSGY